MTVLVQFSDGTYGVRKGWIFKRYRSKYSGLFFGKKSSQFEDSCRMTYAQAKRSLEELKNSSLTDKVLEKEIGMKTLNTLIKELQAMVEEDETVGELPVYVYADHGQTFIQAGEASIDFTLAYDYYADTIHPDDIPEAQEEGEVLQFITIGD